MTHVSKYFVYQCVCVSCLYRKTGLSPAKAGDQHAHNKGTQQTSNSEDRHGERVHEGQGLLVRCSSSSMYHCHVVKILYVLRGYRNGWWSSAMWGNQSNWLIQRRYLHYENRVCLIFNKMILIESNKSLHKNKQKDLTQLDEYKYQSNSGIYQSHLFWGNDIE